MNEKQATLTLSLTGTQLENLIRLRDRARSPRQIAAFAVDVLQQAAMIAADKDNLKKSVKDVRRIR